MAMRPDGDAFQKIGSVRADVVALLREKRYEEALTALYRARSESPADRELQKGIAQIKEFLIGAYAKRLGGLDQLALPIPLAALRSPDAVLLARYIDGTSTFGDLAQMCPLGQLRTLQVLVGLYYGTEPPRIDADAPNSGLRMQDSPAAAPATPTLVMGADEIEPPAPDTARSASVAAVTALEIETVHGGENVGSAASVAVESVTAVETEDSRRYKELFALGTAAFVQRRYAEAVEAFEGCARVRPDDRAAAVMLRRSLRDAEGA